VSIHALSHGHYFCITFLGSGDSGAEMNSFWSTPSEYSRLAADHAQSAMDWAADHAQSAMDWAELHTGLGGWVGAVGAFFAILFAWGLARAEYRRTERRANERKDREIDLLKEIVSEFNVVLMDYYDHAAKGDPLLDTHYPRHMNDPEFHSMSDLAHMPITQWPSIESYAKFKKYWFSAVNDLQNQKKITESVAEHCMQSQIRFNELIDALDEARPKRARHRRRA